MLYLILCRKHFISFRLMSFYFITFLGFSCRQPNPEEILDKYTPIRRRLHSQQPIKIFVRKPHLWAGNQCGRQSWAVISSFIVVLVLYVWTARYKDNSLYHNYHFSSVSAWSVALLWSYRADVYRLCGVMACL